MISIYLNLPILFKDLKFQALWVLLVKMACLDAEPLTKSLTEVREEI